MISALPQQYKGPIKLIRAWSTDSWILNSEFLSAKRLILILWKFQTSRQRSARSSSASIFKMADDFFIGRDRPWTNKNFGEGTISDHKQSKEVKYPGHDESLESALLHNDQSAIFSMVKENSYSSFSQEINHQVWVPKNIFCKWKYFKGNICRKLLLICWTRKEQKSIEKTE